MEKLKEQNVYQQMDIYGGFSDIHEHTKKKNSEEKKKHLEEKKRLFLDEMPTPKETVERDLQKIKDVYTSGILSYRNEYEHYVNTISYSRYSGENIHTNYYSKNFCTCGCKWTSLDTVSRSITCPNCGKTVMKYDNTHIDTAKFREGKTINASKDNYFYVRKLNSTTIRIERYLSKWTMNENGGIDADMPLFSYAVVDFKNKKIAAKKKLGSVWKDITITEFFTLSKKLVSFIVFPNHQLFREFIYNNDGIKKYSGYKEYTYIYEKYFKSKDINGYQLNDFYLFATLLLVMEKIPNIELLLKSYAACPCVEIIKDIIKYSVEDTKTNIENLSDLLNPEANSVKTAIKCPAYIIKDLEERSENTLEELTYFINVHQGYNLENKVFKAKIHNLNEDLYPAILDDYANEYKANDGIKKLVYQAKKKNLDLETFKENVRNTNLEAFGKDAYLKYQEIASKVKQKGININKEQMAYILGKGISLEKEINYITKMVNQLDEAKSVVRQIDDMPINDELKSTYYNAYVASKINTYIQVHVDYIKMAIETASEGVENMVDIVIDKFPQDLLTAHDRMSDVAAVAKLKASDHTIAENGNHLQKAFDKFVEDKKYFKESEYTIVFPKSAGDISREAQQQHNCIAGYTNSYLQRNCIIGFFRRKDSLEKSFVSVEYSFSGGVKQAYYARNQEIYDPYINDLIRKFGGFVKTANYKKGK